MTRKEKKILQNKKTLSVLEFSRLLGINHNGVYRKIKAGTSGLDIEEGSPIKIINNVKARRYQYDFRKSVSWKHSHKMGV